MFAAIKDAYLQTAKLAERRNGERQAPYPYRRYFKHTFTAGADRKIRPPSSYRQSENHRKNAEFPATKSDYGYGRLDEKFKSMIE